MTNILLKFSLFCFLLMISACSGRNIDSNGREEVILAGDISDSAELEKLMEEANEKYQSGNRNLAYAKYKSLVEQFPGRDLPEARLRLVEIAYETGNFQEVPKLAEGFLKLNSRSEAAPYVIYLAGVSEERSYGGTGRDTSSLSRAKNHFQQIVSAYQQSDYFIAAKKALQRIEAKLAGHQTYISNYYLKSGNKAASDARSSLTAD